MIFAARTVVTGIAVGRAAVVQDASKSAPTLGDLAARRLAIAQARAELRSEIEGLRERTDRTSWTSLVDLQSELLDDPMFTELTERAVQSTQAELSVALMTQAQAVAEQWRAMPDEAMRARADDVIGLAERVSRAIGGAQSVVSVEDKVVFARSVDVLMAVELVTSRASGVVVAELSPLGHAAIVLRAADLPTAVCADAVAAAQAGAQVVLDAVRARVIVDATSQEVMHASRRAKTRTQRLARRRKTLGPQTVTPEGHRVRVFSNVDVLAFGVNNVDVGDGVGLCRTEIALADLADFSADSQLRALEPLVKRCGTLPTVIRAFDWGGDKPLPARWSHADRSSRGVQLIATLRAPFEAQAEALLRLAANADVRWLWPWVECAQDVERVHVLINDVAARLSAQGIAYRVPAVGAMIESTQGVGNAPAISGLVEFHSIGTSDLAASALGRTRESLGADAVLEPAFLRALSQLRTSLAMDTEVALCGDAASDPRVVELAFGMGFRAWTASTAGAQSVRTTVSGLDALRAKNLAKKAISCATKADVLALFKA